MVPFASQVEGTTALIANRICPATRGLILVGLWLAALAADARGQQPALASDAEALAQRACHLADSGKFDEVEPILAKLARLQPSSNARLAAVLFASERAYAHGDREFAAKWLQPLSASAPQKFQKAITDAVAWCDVDPTDLEIPSARLLELADQHGATSIAAVALQLRAEKLAAEKQPDEAIFVYRGLLARYPKSRYATPNMLAVAQLHYDLVQDRNASEWLEKLFNEHSDAPQIPAALSLGAEVARRMKLDEVSRQCLERLVTKYETSEYWPDAVCRLTERQLDTGKAVDEKLVAKALVQATSKSELHHRLAFVQIRLAVAADGWETVEQHAEQLVKSKPDEPLRSLAGFWNAEAAYRRGQNDTAFTRFLDLSMTIDRRKDDWLGIVPLRLAQIEAQLQKWSAALNRAEQLAKERPEYSRLHEVEYLRGRSLAALGRFDEARQALNNATTATNAAGTETAAMAQWMIGETWFQQKRYEQAIAAYEKTLSCNFPQWRAAALLQAGKCCEHLGRWSDASQRYEQVVSGQDNNRYVAEAKTRLTAARERVNLTAQQPSTETRK